MNARATPFYTRRFISGINTKFSRVLHTQKLKDATYKHMRCAEYMHVQYCTCTRAAHTIHPYCMHARTQKLVQHHTHAIQAYEEMYAVCVQLFTCSMYAVHNNCMYAAHNNCTHLAYIYSDVCNLMCMYVACVWR